MRSRGPWPGWRARGGYGSLASALLIVATLVACKGDTVRTAPPLRVSVAPVAPHRFAQVVDTISTLEAPDEVNLAAQAGGRIESLRIRQGDAVKAGQLLVVLDQAQLQEEVRALEGQRQESRLNLQRFEYLARQGAASAIQRDALRQNYLAADAAWRAKRADLAYKDLRAPIAGVVSDVAVKAGDVIRAGMPFTTIQRSATLLARLEVPARFGRQVRVGQQVLLNAPSGANTVQGRVVSIDPRVNNATQAFLVKAEVRNAGDQFRNGERVRTRLLIDDRPRLAVPALAVTRTSGQAFVFVLGNLNDLERFPGNAPLERLRSLPAETSFALQRPVRLGPLQDNRYPVLRGLEAGQMLITSNLSSLRHGTPVTAP